MENKEKVNLVVQALQLSAHYKNLLHSVLNSSGGMTDEEKKEITDRLDGIDTEITNLKKLLNPSTDLFEVVTELPIENISTSKIYCVRSVRVEEGNKYTEYIYIRQTDGQYVWEKIGEFIAQPSLSKYARLDEYNIFNGDNYFNGIVTINGKFIINNIKSNNSIYLRAYDENDQSSTKTYVTNGGLVDIGTEENLVFTLEDGSKVTKKIRVLSSTTTPAT